MSPAAPWIAVLDDEANMRTALRRLLSPRGYEVRLYATADELLEACDAPGAGCIILDLHMPGKTGFDVLEALRERPQPPPVIVITGHDQDGNEQRVRSLGARAYLLKPVDQLPLLESIRTLMGHPERPSPPG